MMDVLSRNMSCFRVLAAVCGLWMSQGVLAQEPPLPDASAPCQRGKNGDQCPPQRASVRELDRLLVRERRLRDDTPSVAGPMHLSLRQTPQSVSVIGSKRMREQGMTTTIDALRWVPGLNLDRMDESESTTVYSRGWQIDNIQIDGVSVQGSTPKLPADLALYERVEVLRGPAGLFSGTGTSGSAGGAINLARKRAEREKHVFGQLSAASWDNYRASLDVNLPLTQGGRVRNRTILSHIDRKFFYDEGYRINTTVGTTFTVDLGERTLFNAGLDWEHRRARPTYYGLPRNFDGSDPHWPRRKTTVLPWGGQVMNEYGTYLSLEHDFRNDWHLKLNYIRKKSDNAYDYGAIESNIDRESGELVYYIESFWNQRAGLDQAFDLHLNGAFELFGRRHEFVTGFNLQHNRYWTLSPVNRGYGYTWSYNRVPVDFVNFDPSLYPHRENIVDYDRKSYYQPDRQLGVYANVRLRLLDPLVLTAGVRNTRYREGGYNRYYTDPPVYNVGAYRENGTVTPFFALSYDLGPSHTVHASYADIFKVQDRYDLNGDRVKPLVGENYELGWKSEWNDGRVNSMLSAYKLQRLHATWLAIPSPCPALFNKRGIVAGCSVADDKERTIGIDAELSGQLTPHWELSAGAHWMRKKNVRYTLNYAVPNTVQGQSWGDNRPARKLSVWSLHRLPGSAENWQLGVGMQWQSKTWTAYNESIYRHPDSDEITAIRPAGRVDEGAYALFNAMASWQINRRWNAQLNVDNLFNGRYLTTLNRWWINHTEPRRFALTLSARLD